MCCRSRRAFLTHKEDVFSFVAKEGSKQQLQPLEFSERKIILSYDTFHCYVAEFEMCTLELVHRPV